MLGIIVAYRDRAEHLKAFLPHIRAYFERDKLDRTLPYRMLIVEQANQLKFNIGILKNAGSTFLADCDQLCFHDVDFLPVWADYSPVDRPTRLIWHGAETAKIDVDSRYTLHHNYAQLFGGVILVPRADFELVNGYPTVYWGWGSEDTELRTRFEAMGRPVAFRDGTFTALKHRKAGHDPATGQLNEVGSANKALRQSRLPIIKAANPADWDGLSTLEFRTLQRQTLVPADSAGRGHFEHVQIDFAGPA